MPRPALALVADNELHHYRVCADPNGLAFDAHRDALYVADARAGTIHQVSGPRVLCLAEIELGANDRLGGLAITPYGTLYVNRLHGTTGSTLYQIEPDGQTIVVEQLSPRLRRLGITYDPYDHVLYLTQYSKAADGTPYDGCIIEIDLVDGFVSPMIGGFQKPVGIAKLGSTLLVTDARQRAVFRVEIAAGRAFLRSPIASDLDRPDSICACGPDSVLVTTYDDAAGRGSVRQLWLDGRTRTIASGAWEPRGVACDDSHAFVSARRGGRVLVFRL